MKNFEHDYLPSAKEMYTFSRHYAPEHFELDDPRISPAFADLSGMIDFEICNDFRITSNICSS